MNDRVLTISLAFGGLVLASGALLFVHSLRLVAVLLEYGSGREYEAILSGLSAVLAFLFFVGIYGVCQAKAGFCLKRVLPSIYLFAGSFGFAYYAIDMLIGVYTCGQFLFYIGGMILMIISLKLVAIGANRPGRPGRYPGRLGVAAVWMAVSTLTASVMTLAAGLIFMLGLSCALSRSGVDGSGIYDLFFIVDLILIIILIHCFYGAAKALVRPVAFKSAVVFSCAAVPGVLLVSLRGDMVAAGIFLAVELAVAYFMAAATVIGHGTASGVCIVRPSHDDDESNY
ncbi:MAG: hypothetical protein AB7F40_06370 [Victivallaceae bacterium]